MVLAASRRVRVFLENPLNSSLFHMPCINCALDTISATPIVTYMGAFGQPTLKPAKLFVTHDARLAARLLEVSKAHAQGVLSENPKRQEGGLVKFQARSAANKRKTGWKDGSWVTKTPGLKESKEYPKKFCSKMRDLIIQTVNTVSL